MKKYLFALVFVLFAINQSFAQMCDVAESKEIIGHDIFQSGKFSYEPNMNIATPASYALEPGDEVLTNVYNYIPTVGAYNALVSVHGAVKCPMYYKMKERETLKVALEYAGGFKNVANKKSVSTDCHTTDGLTVHSLDKWNFASFAVQNGGTKRDLSNLIYAYWRNHIMSGLRLPPDHNTRNADFLKWHSNHTIQKDTFIQVFGHRRRKWMSYIKMLDKI